VLSRCGVVSFPKAGLLSGSEYWVYRVRVEFLYSLSLLEARFFYLPTMIIRISNCFVGYEVLDRCSMSKRIFVLRKHCRAYLATGIGGVSN
jgi:hypothetical protein